MSVHASPATSGPPTLKTTCEAILRLHWHSVTDVGDTPYDVLANLLKLCDATQLFLLEESSPHIKPYTSDIWKALCVSDFIDVRRLVEDGRLSAHEENTEWRERYIEEEKKREIKMQASRSKMRGQYSDYSAGRGTVQTIDGLRQEKRRKISHPTPMRPKTLLDKARSNTRAITSIYAPKRPAFASGKAQTTQPTKATPTIARTTRPPARTPTGTSGPSVSSRDLKKPVITTVVRTFKRAAPTAVTSADASAQAAPVHSTQHPSSGSSTVRRFASTASSSRNSVLSIGVLGAIVGTAVYTQSLNSVIELEQEPGKAFVDEQQGRGPRVFLWGRNSHAVASPASTISSTVKRPLAAPALNDVVLRDLAISATYGCAVDSQGDVLQWGHGYGGPEGAVEHSVRGKDIVQVRPTEEGKVFGLSKKGEVYVWASDKLRQTAGAAAAEVQRPREGWGWKLLGRGLLWGGGGGGVGVQVLKVNSDVKLGKGESFVSLSSGQSHLLALTSSGRAFALPLSLDGNRYGQLGVRAVSLLAPPHPGSSATGALSVRLEPDERLNETGRDRSPAPAKRIDPLLLPAVPSATPFNPIVKDDRIPSPPAFLTSSNSANIQLHPSPAEHTAIERSPQFCTTLHEIPSLRGVEVAELVAGKNHSLARLAGRMEGRVLGWGANAYGQLGLGSALSYPSIPAPTEVPLAASPSYTMGGSAARPASVRCERLAAGGNVSYFVVSTSKAGGSIGSTAGEGQDLLACGQGQFGAVGNGMWAHATSPVRVKTISGLTEWNESAGRVESIKIRDVQAGDGHVAVVLDNAVSHASGVSFGRDVFVWGHNEHYQLGTGKRSNLAIPQHLAPLPYTAPRKEEQPATTESVISSGTTSPMPHNRLQLSPTISVSPTLLALNRGLNRKSRIEEAIVAGDGGSGVYWRVLNP
ncbi:hypothetical protein JCM11251_006546 [Rhodosporidiobolus azoricus]